MIGMTDKEEKAVDPNRIKKAVLNDIQRANSFFTTKIEPTLRKRHQIYEADRAYYAKRFKNTAHQSDFVSFDFWSMVQWAIPVVMNSFFGNDDAVVIVGRNEEDVPRAELLKSLVDFQMMTQNKGFLVLWDWFSDAFEYNLGAVKIWWERVEDWDKAKLEYADMSRVMMLQSDPWCEIEYVSPPDMFGMCQVSYRIGRLKSNKPVIEPVRVTDLRWSPEAKSLKDANFVAHKQVVSADHLRRQAKNGIYDADAVERAIENTANGGVIYSAFETELNDELDQRLNEDDSARALYELYECYVKLDINGDGLLEDALISVVGDELLRVTENPYGRVPIFTLSPVRDPFKVLADISLAEIVGALIFGAVLGIIMTQLVRLYTGRGNRLAVTVAMTFLCIGVCNMTGFSSLLACMMMSAVFANTSRYTDKIFEPLDRMTPPFYMMFFILSGASLDITIIPKIGLVGAVYVIVRVLGKMLGAYIGALISKAPAVVRKYLGLTLIPQEGVAIGLVTVAKGSLPQYGSTIQTVVLCGIVIYELLGPMITKLTLKAAKEIA